MSNFDDKTSVSHDNHERVTVSQAKLSSKGEGEAFIAQHATTGQDFAKAKCDANPELRRSSRNNSKSKRTQ